MAEKSTGSIQRRPSDSTTDLESVKLKKKEQDWSAWLTVLGSMLIYYSSFGILNSFGFFQDFYSRNFLKTTPSAAIAFVGTLQMALMNSLAGIAGSLCDRHGIKYLYIGSGSGTIISLLILSCIQAGQFWQVLLVQGLFMGTTIAFGVQPALTIVAQHFKERRAFAMGLVLIGSSLGGIGFPLMFERLVPLIGFSNALRLAAVKIAICYALALCLSRGKPMVLNLPKSRSLLFDFRGFLDPRYSVLCLGTFFAVLGMWIPSYYIKTYSHAVYPGNTIGKYFLCMIYSCNIVGAVFGGLIGDKIGRLNLLWPMTLLSGLLVLFLWLLSDTLSVLALFACLYGFCTSMVTSLPPPVIVQITPDHSIGARMGAFYSLIAVASLVGTPIGGALISNPGKKDGYDSLIMFSGISIITGAIFMLASRVLHETDLRRRW